MLRIFLCLFVILPALAFAQPCLPAKEAPATAPHIWEQPPQNVAWIGTPMQYGLSIRGGWVRWYCAEVNGPGFVRVTRVSTLADLPNVQPLAGRASSSAGGLPAAVDCAPVSGAP